MKSSISYRPEVDGLRTIAVLGVLIFHADLGGTGAFGFTGGFLGVDIFFVISGYLISSIIINSELKQGFSFANFYYRRLKRIYPALVTVILFVVISAPFFLSGYQLLSTAKSAIASILSVSNFYFLFLEGDYWATPSKLEPLLHTWSLGVEEQFYLIAPLLLIFAIKTAKERLGLAVLGFTIVSLLVAELWSETHPSSAFYMLPARAWELSVGSLLAVLQLRVGLPTPGGRWSGVASMAGLALVIFSMFAFTASTQHPSIYTIVPVIGVAAMIWFSSPQNFIGKVLAAAPTVAIGKISYSLYLWHYPVFVFARMEGAFETLTEKLTVIALVFVLSTISYFLVEKPFRRENLSWKFVSGAVGAASAAAILVSVMIMPPPTEDLALSTGDVVPAACEGYQSPTGEMYCLHYGQGAPEFVIWGDSHVGIFHFLQRYQSDVPYLIIRHPGCPPLLGVTRYDGLGNAANCDSLDIMQYNAEYIRDQGVDRVVLVARWSMYTNGFHRNDVRMSQHSLLTHDAIIDDGPDGSQSALAHGLARTVEFFGPDIEINLVDQAPDLQRYSPIQSIDGAVPLAEIREWHAAEASLFDNASASPNVSRIRTRDHFCDRAGCRLTAANGEDLYRDDNHITETGALPIFQELMELTGTGR